MTARRRRQANEAEILAELPVSVNEKPEARYNCRALERIVGRERYQRTSHRQLARNAVVSRRVDSDVRLLLSVEK